MSAKSGSIALLLAGVVLMSCVGRAPGADRLGSVAPTLKAYHEAFKNSAQVSCESAYAHKTQPTSEMVGLDAWDTMRELNSLQLRIDYVNSLHEQLCGNATRVRVARSMLWSGNPWAFRRLILPMLTWDIHIGICRCYILYTGQSREMVDMLSKLLSIKMYFPFAPFASTEQAAKWKEWMKVDHFEDKVGGEAVMSLQHFANSRAIEAARQEGFHWLTHIDDDELLVPSTSLADELLAVPPWVGGLTFNNMESQAEAVDVINRFEQVTLFKLHGNLATSDVVDSYGWHFLYGNWNGWWFTYYNGKAIVRVDGPKVEPWGPHNFAGGDDDGWKDPVNNPQGRFMERMSNTTVVLHYSYVNWADVLKKASRACPERYKVHVWANNDTLLKDCFFLDFDQMSYKVAVREGARGAKRFWVTNALYSEGLFVQEDPGSCRVYPNTRWLRSELIRANIFRRITVVRETMRAHELALRQMARQRGPEAAAKLLPLGGMPEHLLEEARRRRR